MLELGKSLGVEVEGGEDVEMDDVGGKKGGSAFEVVQKAVEKVVREGYSATQVLTQVGSLYSLSLGAKS